MFSKKNVIKKSFSGVLQFIGVARIFDWVGQNHKSHAMTSSKIRLLALNQDFAKGEGLNQGLREGVQGVHRTRGLGGPGLKAGALP